MSRPNTPAFALRRPGINTAQQLSSASASGSRSTTPLARGGVTLDEWERHAPLSDEQLQSISYVRDRLSERPLPDKFQTEGEPSTPRPSSPSAPIPKHLSSRPLASPSYTSSARSSRPSSMPASPAPASSSQQPHNNDPLHPSFPLATPQQFHDHFAALTLSTEHEQDSLYRDHLAEITGLRERCDGLMELLEEGEGEVEEMLKALGYVEERSESLRGACEDLLEEQTHLLTHTSQLAHRLTFFTFLETAQKMLNTTRNDLVLNEGFLPMVKRLDECLGYLGEHRDFKDAELYLIRYQQCMTRSMTLIKIYFVNTIKQLGQDVLKRINDKGMSETAIQALIYTKFTSLSSALRPLLAELEHRSTINPDELASLLAECHAAWMSSRQGIVGPRVAVEVGRMEPARAELVELTRSGCSYLKQVCLDEFNLFKHFFLSGEAPLYGFLESLYDHLYDHLRPRILHEPSLEVLCGVCTVLQALMVTDHSSLDPSTLDDPDNDEEVLYSPNSTPGVPSPMSYSINGGDDYFMSRRPSNLRRGSSHSTTRAYSTTAGSIRTRKDSQRRKTKPRKPLGRLHTEILLRMVLQDAQTRLVFRAQALLRADVEYYAPKEGDLDYPEKLGAGSMGKPLVQRQSAVSLDDDDDDEPAFLALPPKESQESWYPSLRVTLWVLSCLHTYVDSVVFEDLAQEAVMTCRRSLTSASDLMAAKKDKEEDAKLFLVRHLLILKEMTAGLDLGRKERKGEWSGITDFLRSLLENASSLLGYQKGQIVRPAESAVDAKTDIDRTLKTTCEALIDICAQRATFPLRAFLDKSSAYLATRPPSTAGGGGASDLPSQDFATPDKVRAVHDEFRHDVRGKVEEWRGGLMRYLQDEETVRVLIPPTNNSIVEVYRQFHDLVRAEYDFATAAGLMTPSAVATLLAGDVSAGAK